MGYKMNFLFKRREKLNLLLVPCLTILLILYIITSQMFLLLFHGRYVYLYIAQILFLGIAVYMVINRKLLYVQSIPAGLIVISMFFSFSSALRNLELPYVQTAAAEWFQFIVLYFIAAFVEERIKADRFLKLIVTVLKWMCLVHVCFILAEYIMFHFKGINIRNLLFFDLLGMDTGNLWFDAGNAVTGFSFSQPLLSPMFIIGMLLFTNPLIRLLFLAVPFICDSSTAVAGACLCAVLLVISAIMDGKFKAAYIKERLKKMPLWQKIGYAVAFGGIVAVLLFGGFLGQILSEAEYLFARISHAGEEQHLVYFKDMIAIWKQSPIYQKLFGYGNGCSGYPMTVIRGYTTFPGPCIVECDIVDMVLSRGIFGLIAAYSLWIVNAVKGYRVDKRYAIATICFLVMGIGYNVQWHYMLFFMLLEAVCLAEKKDLYAVKQHKIDSKK